MSADYFFSGVFAEKWCNTWFLCGQFVVECWLVDGVFSGAKTTPLVRDLF
jgi:hypothetical protein